MSHSTPSQPEPFRLMWLKDLKREAEPKVDWLWQGYLAAENITLLTSQWKAGKTTLLALLLDRMRNGGELAGLPVRAGKAAVLSEESPALWLERSKRFHFAGHVCWFCRPFTRRPDAEQWQALLDQILAVHEQVGLSLLAIDPLAAFFPRKSETNADLMIAALLPLQRLAAAGVSVLILHHPRKHSGTDGHSARGSGALSAHVDILLELHWWRAADEASRRRRLLAWSRHEITPRERVIELSEDGREYVEIPDAADEELQPLRTIVWRILESSPIKLTRSDIVDNWPAESPTPHPFALGRLLERAVENGELRRDGGGVKADPYRYWLPSLEQRWKTDAVARVQQNIADARRAVEYRIPGF